MRAYVCVNVQTVYSLRTGSPDAWTMLSLATSWWSLGMGFGQIVLLKDLIPYRNKQSKKIRELENEGSELLSAPGDVASVMAAKALAWMRPETNTIQANALLAAAKSERQPANTAEATVTSSTVCPGNCGVLRLVTTPVAGYFCDLCAKTFPRATDMLGCSKSAPSI